MRFVCITIVFDCFLVSYSTRKDQGLMKMLISSGRIKKNILNKVIHVCSLLKRYTHYIHSVVVQDFVSGRVCCVNQYIPITYIVWWYKTLYQVEPVVMNQYIPITYIVCWYKTLYQVEPVV
jgi:hypothetical protein